MPEADHCPRCGTSVYADAMKDGLCPACLMKLALSASDVGEAPDEPELPDRIGPFEILEVLGRGGMGVVYRARDSELGREVAIKLLPPEFGQDPGRLERFQREAKLLAALNHPNIATIHSIGKWRGLPYFVLELVAGESLAARLGSDPLEISERFDICAQIARGLQAAHAEGIVHRDLKPANVMVTPTGLAKILDFGIARSPGRESDGPDNLTATGTLIGTVPYMSPEQVRGGEVDERSDVWAFGCLMHEVLTGRPPFERDTPADTLSAILEQDPDLDALPRSVTASVRNLLRDCLRKDPAQRTHDMGTLASALDQESAEIHRRAAAGPTFTRTEAVAGWLVGTTGALLVAVVALGALLPSVARDLVARAPGVFAIIPNGGQLVVVALLVGAMGTLAWELGRTAGKHVSGRVTQRRVGIAVALVGAILVAVSAATGHVLTAAATALLGGPAWLITRRRSAIRAPLWIIPASMVFFFGATYSAEGWWSARQNDAVNVYVVLPFKRLNDELQQELLDASEHYRSTLEAVFGGLDSIRVLPRSFSVEPLSGLPPQCTSERLEVWAEDSSLEPDFVLCGTMDLFDQEGTGRGIKLVYELNRIESDTLRPIGRKYSETAAYEDIRYGAIRTTFVMLDVLTTAAGVVITAEEEASILGRILDEYEDFLAFRPPGAEDAAARARQARLEDSLSRTAVAGALDAYTSPVDAALYMQQQKERAEAIGQRVGGNR